MKKHVTLIVCFLFFSISSCKRPPLPPPVVLFDQAHGQTASINRTGPSDISKFKELFIDQGFVVRINTTAFNEKTFVDVAAVIISGPLTPFGTTEIQVIVNYLKNGGQMCFMLENPSSLAELLANLQVAVANGIVHEQENILAGIDSNFSVQSLPKHPLTSGLETFNVYGAWPLKTALEANIIAQTSTRSWVDLNGDNLLGKQDAIQSFSILITGQLGHGHFVVFGDNTLLHNQYLTGVNKILGQNLARWFKEGSYY